MSESGAMPTSAGRLADVLHQQGVEERERALRTLLMRPLLTAADPDYSVVRKHADTLRGWLQRETGWTLQVDRDCARLFKRPADTTDGMRPATTLDGRKFDRQRYVLLCLIAALLERAEPQISLRQLGERLLEAAADPELSSCGFRFSLETVHDRRALVHVCRFLIESCVLVRVAGDEEAYIHHGGQPGTGTTAGDALYDVQRRVLGRLFAGARGPSGVERAAEPLRLEERLAFLVEEYVPESAEGRQTAVRHRLARRLLDDPVVYFDELSPEEHAYFLNQRGAMGARLRAASGLVPELRAEGTALVDPDGTVSDEQLPAEGTEAHATLLIAQFLADAARASPQRIVPESEISAFLAAAAVQYGRYWRKDAREPGASAELSRQALRRLASLKLLRLTDAGVEARPALLRYRLGEPELRQAGLPLP